MRNCMFMPCACSCRSISIVIIVCGLISVGRAQGLVSSGGKPGDITAGTAEPAVFSAAQELEIERRIEQALRAEPKLTPKLGFGYQNGFLISSPAGVKTEPGAAFTMRINSWMQFRHTVFDSQTANPSENDLEFERLRLTFQGNVYSTDLRYFIQFDGDSDQSEVADWLDYYITADVGHAAGFDPGSFGIKVGKWKLPYSRARAESGWKLQFTDRSVASVFFDINRSQAVGLFGNFGFLGRTVNWETAVSNGFKTGGARPSRLGELDRNFGYSGRLWSDWIGDWGTDGEADLDCHQQLAMRVGAGFAHTRLNREGLREFASTRVVDSGDRLVDLLPATVSAYDYSLYALDANWKLRGSSLMIEYYFRHMDGFTGAVVNPLFDHGFVLQGGRFILRETLELIARWSRIQGDSGTLGTRDQSFDEVAGGVVWYLNGQRAKLTFDVTRLNGAPVFDPTLNILPGDDGMMYRTQFQLYF